MTNFLKRLASGIIMIAIALFCLIKGDYYFWLLCASIAYFCSYEIITFKQITGLNKALIFGITSLLLLSTIFNDYRLQWTSPIVLTLAYCFILFSLIELAQKKLLLNSNKWLISIHTLFLINLSIPFAIIIRQQQNGFMHLLFILIIVATTDSVAYVIGKFFGKHPISPISPKKTLEGSIAGLLFATLSAFIFLYYAYLPVLPYLYFAISISVLSQLGDLHQSLNKRAYNIKDSSNLIPGHGGFYDRLDGYLLTLPFFMILSHLFL
jgi:phosphatidate cytidylyltransferase